MENRIKEQQLNLFADRTSTVAFAGNQLPLWFSTFACLLVARLRDIALQSTVLAKATAGTIRLRLFTVAAMVAVSARWLHVRMASAFPLQEVFRQTRRTRRLLPRSIALHHAHARHHARPRRPTAR